MKRDISIDKDEAQLFEDVLGYILFEGDEGDREKDDFIKRLEEEGLEESEVFNEHGILQATMVPTRLKNHIYYKAAVLHSALMPEIYGA